MNNKSFLLKHFLVWVIFIAYEVAYVEFTVGVTASVFNFLLFYVLNIGLFYFNAHVVLDFAFFKTNKPYVLSVGFILLELAAYLIIKFLLDYLIAPSRTSLLSLAEHDKRYALTNTWRGIYFIGFSIAYWSLLYLVRFRERNHQMETEQLKSMAHTLELENKYISIENAYLQNQISPHLLFNSLNFIYNKVYPQSEEAGNSVSRLSDLMRYSLVSTEDSGTVPLKEEVDQLENLVELCRMRFKDHFYLKFKKRGKPSGLQIIPLILVTLVENMMKHGDMGDQAEPALIQLIVSDTRLNFETRNKKRNTNLYPKKGLGLKNIEKRLSNAYPDRYRFDVTESPDLFITHLTLQL